MATRRHASRPRSAPIALDAVDRRLLVALSRDGRRPAADLAKQLGLSRQTVAERIRTLERRGVIRGFHAAVDPVALGLGVRAHIRLTMAGTLTPQAERDALERLTAEPAVRAVHRVSGEDCFVADVVCRRIEDVNALLQRLQATRALASSRTSFVLEQVLDKGGLGPIEPELAELEPARPARRS